MIEIIYTKKTMSEIIKAEENNNSLPQLMEIASYYIKSKYLPENIKTPEQAVLIIQKGKELGFQPLQSFEAIDVIMGKATLKPKAKAGLARRTGKVWWKTVKDWEPMYNKETGELMDYETVIKGYRVQEGHLVEEDCRYTYSEAASMGLVTKDNWKKQPKIMAYWRCLSRLLDRIAPDLTGGLYMTDELADVANVNYSLTEDGEVKIIE